MDRQIERQRDRKIEIQKDRNIDRQIGRQVDRLIDRWIDRWIDRQIERQKDKYKIDRQIQLRFCFKVRTLHFKEKQFKERISIYLHINLSSFEQYQDHDSLEFCVWDGWGIVTCNILFQFKVEHF